MISIIICSRNPDTYKRFDENIKHTIGAEYEMVVVDNSKGMYGICGAYNEGVRCSKGDILCFMHEDIIYHSHEWGKRIEEYMQEDSVGILGVAGSVIVPDRGDWRFLDIRDTYLIQGYHTYNRPAFYYRKGIEWDTQHPIKKVAVIDGCWFCIKRELFSIGQLKFDEDNFPGFHMYDTDICMQVNKIGRYIYLCSDIVLEHTSEGLYTHEFEESLEKFLKKWNAVLPYSVESVDKCLLEKKENEAERKLAVRIEKDRLIMSIRDFYDESERGIFIKPLPVEAQRFMELSLLEYIKVEIKYSTTNKEAYDALCLCFKHRKKVWNMIFKYLYYRFINRRFIRCRKFMQLPAIK